MRRASTFISWGIPELRKSLRRDFRSLWPHPTAGGGFQPRLRFAATLKTYRRCSARSGAIHDPHRVFAGIQPLAFVPNELLLDVGVCVLRPAYSLGICCKLGVAIFTYAKHRNIFLTLDDPKLAFRSSDPYGCCSAGIARRSMTVMALLDFVWDGLKGHERHRVGLRRRE